MVLPSSASGTKPRNAVTAAYAFPALCGYVACRSRRGTPRTTSHVAVVVHSPMPSAVRTAPVASGNTSAADAACATWWGTRVTGATMPTSARRRRNEAIARRYPPRDGRRVSGGSRRNARLRGQRASTCRALRPRAMPRVHGNATASTASGASPAAVSAAAIAWTGNAALNRTRSNRSSLAANTGTPSTRRTAAASCPKAFRPSTTDGERCAGATGGVLYAEP